MREWRLSWPSCSVTAELGGSRSGGNRNRYTLFLKSFVTRNNDDDDFDAHGAHGDEPGPEGPRMGRAVYQEQGASRQGSDVRRRLRKALALRQAGAHA